MDTHAHLVTLGAMDKVNLAHISHNLSARDVLHGERVRKHLLHFEYGNKKMIELSGRYIKSFKIGYSNENGS
jgi:hypothetical protein